MAVKKEPEVKETVEVIDTSEKSYEDKIAELMAAAEERANAVIEKAEKAAEEIVKKATKATDKTSTDEENKKINDELEEYTVVQLFKGDGKYADDVFLAVNGENCVVKRGYPVKIKKKFALILEQSYQQDIMANEYMSQKQDEFFKKANEYV
nr:MAG TPA: hypothetical protein [Caudoviricetes sp.]